MIMLIVLVDFVETSMVFLLTMSSFVMVGYSVYLFIHFMLTKTILHTNLYSCNTVNIITYRPQN